MRTDGQRTGRQRRLTIVQRAGAENSRPVKERYRPGSTSGCSGREGNRLVDD